MDEIRAICNSMQSLDNNGTWYDIPIEWSNLSEIERYNMLDYITGTCHEWIDEGIADEHRHILDNVLDMVEEIRG